MMLPRRESTLESVEITVTNNVRQGFHPTTTVQGITLRSRKDHGDSCTTNASHGGHLAAHTAKTTYQHLTQRDMPPCHRRVHCFGPLSRKPGDPTLPVTKETTSGLRVANPPSYRVGRPSPILTPTNHSSSPGTRGGIHRYRTSFLAWQI
jgi:hypothetical protein